MKRVYEIITETYRTGNEDFFLDVVIHTSGPVQFETWLYRDSVGIKDYVTGYMREYGYTVEEVVDDMESYLNILDNNGNTWYTNYDREYRGDI